MYHSVIYLTLCLRVKEIYLLGRVAVWGVFMIIRHPKTWQLSAIISKMVHEIGCTVGRLIGNHMWPVRSKSKGKKHETRPIATDVSCIVVCPCVGHMSCAKTAEPIAVPFEV